MGKSSQTKGRGGEFECARQFAERGIDVRVHGQYEPGDISIKLDGQTKIIEVKRKRNGMKAAYDAIENDCLGLGHRSDRREWLMTVEMDHYIDLAIRAGAVEVNK